MTPDESFLDLQRDFLRRVTGRLASMRQLLATLTATPADHQALVDLTSEFHKLAGTGGSYGYPRISALGEEGERECERVTRSRLSPGADDLPRWNRLVDDLEREVGTSP